MDRNHAFPGKKLLSGMPYAFERHAVELHVFELHVFELHGPDPAHHVDSEPIFLLPLVDASASDRITQLPAVTAAFGGWLQFTQKTRACKIGHVELAM